MGQKTTENFHASGIFTVSDLLERYPASYELYDVPVLINEADLGKTVTVKGRILSAAQKGSRKLPVTLATVEDGISRLSVTWFRMPWLIGTLRPYGKPVILRGILTEENGRFQMTQPEVFLSRQDYEKKQGTLQPNYPLGGELKNHQLLKAMASAFEKGVVFPETLPAAYLSEFGFPEKTKAVKDMHFPPSLEGYKAARARLVFEEFFFFALTLKMLKARGPSQKNACPMKDNGALEIFKRSLPYALTNAQNTVIGEILSDLAGAYTMSRLVEGDVGSGKTVVAMAALLVAAENGYQGALLAPTEVLARQHAAEVATRLLKAGFSHRVVLLTGSMKEKEKNDVREKIADGRADIIVGTHALITENVSYARLGLVVTDEQHRFGVRQREAFAEKGVSPHVLVMSATPIPRTLAIILYGDLSLSLLDEKPGNRLPIKNCVIPPGKRMTALMFITDEVHKGRQAYVICPMVEESAHMEAENVTDYAEKLRQLLPEDIRIGHLHGRMKGEEKDRIMTAFKNRDIDVLVSTTVIEVGIDVPNATVMMIENAERFGLSQLHQLRGRVGRGSHQSYAIFISGSKSENTRRRLKALEASNDGFEIAESDLRLRGPGDLFGIRQSGIMGFRLGDIYQDAEILKWAGEKAEEIMVQDPDLTDGKNRLLRETLIKKMRDSDLSLSL